VTEFIAHQLYSLPTNFRRLLTHQPLPKIGQLQLRYAAWTVRTSIVLPLSLRRTYGRRSATGFPLSDARRHHSKA